MYIFLIALVLLASLLMVLIVLVQNSKGGGLASGFSSNNQYMGVRKTTDFLEKATWVLAAAMCVLSLMASAFVPKDTVSGNESELKEQINNAVKIDPNIVAPNFGEENKGDANATSTEATETPATPAATPAETPAASEKK
ncbi:MAG: preprotein translocase subunit SecG [Bacteroidales bacterium]|jgi:preprotein translocase subunit SecG|nr:preprotein translocase subunit SecG [Bacteroidales bacterium]MDD3161596.1 preprotein translocase subunit SecG [Bacteroidales bacterium]